VFQILFGAFKFCPASLKRESSLIEFSHQPKSGIAQSGFSGFINFVQHAF